MRILIASHFRRNEKIKEFLLKKLSKCDVTNIKSDFELSDENLRSLCPDWIFFPHWGSKVPRSIFEKYKCIIFHMTDLPYGRGGSPLQNLIVRGHKMTKLSAIQCVEEMDAGDIYLQRDLSLLGTAEEIYSRASVLMEKMIFEIVQKKIVPVEQQGEVVSFKRRKRDESNVMDLYTLEQVFDYIRMLDAEGYPKAFIETENLTFEFSSADLKSNDELHAKVIITKRISDE